MAKVYGINQEIICMSFLYNLLSSFIETRLFASTATFVCLNFHLSLFPSTEHAPKVVQRISEILCIS